MMHARASILVASGDSRGLGLARRGAPSARDGLTLLAELPSRRFGLMGDDAALVAAMRRSMAEPRQSSGN